MIPKVIHYCWFGGKEKPEIVEKCMHSWRKFCPDYQIVEWNEKNFDIDCCPYVQEAYERKKWAFVSDYARLYVIFNEGGVYLDTDIELLKSIDDLLMNDTFFGYEDGSYINTGVGFGAVKHCLIIKKILDDYDGTHFIRKDGTMDMIPCPERNSKVFSALGYTLDGTTYLNNKVALYSSEWMCPINYQTGEMNITSKTVSIHHFTGAWMDPEELKIIALERKLKKIIGKRAAFWIRCRMYNIINLKKEFKLR